MLQTNATLEYTRSSVANLMQVCWVREDPALPSMLTLKDGTPICISSTTAATLPAYLERLGARPLAVALISTPDPDQPSEALKLLRSHPAFQRTRVYLVSSGARHLAPDEGGSFDVEGVLDQAALTPKVLAQSVELGVRAFRALGGNPLLPRMYLDATLNQVFDWFENTRWQWSALGDFSKIDRDLLRSEEIEVLKESAVIEFGTLPGAHNFLREWADEYSFSSWALSWGAEEARHSLVQCRYLRAIGIDIPAKHAMYKREPYPMGQNRAGTLMMNIISEARAAAYYNHMSTRTKEPVLRNIWQLLGRDESRHCRAFHIFCKEMCRGNQENTVAALEMAYVWLADRSQGVKHPAGHFYPHSTSTAGVRLMESTYAGATDSADGRVVAMIRDMLGDESIRTVRDLKARLRVLA